MVGIKIDPFNAVVKLVEVSGLDDYYKEIGCDCIDISVVEVDGTPFNVVVDDEGLLKCGAVPSVFGVDGLPRLVNVAIVLGMNDDYDLRSLTLDETLKLADAVCEVKNNMHGGWLALLVD